MLVFEQKRRTPSRELAQKLGRELGISQCAAQLLVARGLADATEADAFLHPGEAQLCDPFDLADMHKAVARIERAICERERICVFGDYDADGVCATAILMLYLRLRQADSFYLIPSRHDEGYGMNAATPGQLAAAGTKLVITVDNGVKAIAELEACYQLGIEAIVTDHHIPGETLPRCEALLLSGAGDYPNRHICGAGLAFKLVEAMAGRQRALEYVSLAGVATVADIVPLFGENRVLAHLAIEAVRARRCPKGLLALLAVAGKELERTDERAFGFVIGPRLNAAGRIEAAAHAVNLLIEEDPDKLAALAERLNALNEQRRGEEAAIYSSACAALEADDLCERRSIVLYDPAWNPGVVGVAAGRVAEKYFRPTVLLTGVGDAVAGSARSIPGVNIHEALRACEMYFTRFGGHAFAAGMALREENVVPFREALDAYIRKNIPEDAFLPRAEYDNDADFSELTRGLTHEIERFAPFGEGNEPVLFRTDGARVTSLRTIGNGGHLGMKLQNSARELPAVLFSAGERFKEINEMDSCDVLCTPEINGYNGELRLNVRALRAAPPADPKEYLARNAAKFADALSKNILYNSTCADFPFRRADADELIPKLARERVSGLVVLCFTRPGAERFLALAAREGLYGRMDIRFGACKGGAAAYNAAVLAPELSMLELFRYRTLVVCDAPMGMGEALAALAPNAELFCGAPVQGDADELAQALRADRDTLAKLYRALCRTPGVFYNREAMRAALVKASGAREREADFALGVFEELGFVRVGEDGARLVKDAPSRSLGESRAFAAANAVFEIFDRHLRYYKEA